ncbi:MAG: hypothetical protein RL196_288 [Actinomycetota bacterium]|jgi:hypothetical protein
MVELAMYNQRDEVGVEPLETGDLRIHLGIDHTAEHIVEALTTQGFDAHVDEAVKLISDDELARDFEPKGEFVLIKAKA